MKTPITDTDLAYLNENLNIVTDYATTHPSYHRRVAIGYITAVTRMVTPIYPYEHLHVLLYETYQHERLTSHTVTGTNIYKWHQLFEYVKENDHRLILK